MLQIRHGSRRHGHDHSRSFKAVCTDAHRVISILTRKRGKDNACVLPHILGLRAICIHTVAFGQIHRNCHHKYHIVAVIKICILIGRSRHMDLYQSRCPGQFLTVYRNAVQLVGHIKRPWQRHLFIVQGTFIIKTSLLVCRQVPDHLTVPKLRLVACGHIFYCRICSIICKICDAIQITALYHIYLSGLSVKIQINIHRFICLYRSRRAIGGQGCFPNVRICKKAASCSRCCDRSRKGGCHNLFASNPHRSLPPFPSRSFPVLRQPGSPSQKPLLLSLPRFFPFYGTLPAAF